MAEGSGLGVQMANLITLLRLLLLCLLVAMAYWASPAVQLASAPLLVLIIALDGLDGYVARRLGEVSVFGSIFDVVADRVVENVLWLVLGDLGLVPMWVAIVFLVRGAVVDTIRYTSRKPGTTVFGMMSSPWGQFIVGGRLMRGLYGTVKALTFGWVLFCQPWPVLEPAVWDKWAPMAEAVTMTLVIASVVLCLVRGLPVVIEFVISHSMIGRLQVSFRSR